MGSYSATIGRGAGHDYALSGVDVDLTIDPDNADKPVGPAIAVLITASADSATFSVLTAGPSPSAPFTGAVTRTFTVSAGHFFRGIAIVKVLAATTATGIRVAWDDAAALAIGSSSGGGTTVTANQGAPNAGGALAWPVVLPTSQASGPLALDATLQLISAATTTLNGALPTRTVVVGVGDGGSGSQPLTASVFGLETDVIRSALPTGAATDTSVTDTNATVGAAAPAKGKYVVGRDGSGTVRAVRTNIGGVLNNVPGLGSANDSTAYESSHVFSTSACEPARLTVYSKNGGALTVMFFNATSLPANGALPKETPIPISPSNRTTTSYVNPTGRYTIGLVGALSTTNSSLTILGTSDGWFSADFFPATA